MSHNPGLSHDSRLPLREGFCNCLRAKEMFYDTGEPIEERLRKGSGLFWCSHTQTCLGPDNDVVSLDDCGPDRECYQR